MGSEVQEEGESQSNALQDGRLIASLLSASRPRGLLEARSAQLIKAGVAPKRGRISFLEALRRLFQRFCGCDGQSSKPSQPAGPETLLGETAAHIFLACWAAACSWDVGFVAYDCWNQASRQRPAEVTAAFELLKPLLGEVSSLFGLFTLLQVVDMGPEGQEKSAAKVDIVQQMQTRLHASGATCPVCLEELGYDADKIVVTPCSHAVHWSCYASSVQAKTSQAGRCLMCRKVSTWSNITISRLLQDFQGFLLAMIMDEDWASWDDEPPGEFLVASACADLSEHLPLLHEVSMTLEHFSSLYAAQKIEISQNGTWMVARELYVINESGRGPLAGPGSEAVGTRPDSVKLPVASSLVSLATLDGTASFNEFELQDAAAFQPRALFEMIHATTGLLTWRVPLPMHLFWNAEFHAKLESCGIHVCEDEMLDLLRHPEPEIFGRLSAMGGQLEDSEASL